VAASDIAQVIAAVLADPSAHVGQVYELTGPRSLTLHELAAEYSRALGRPVRYVDVPHDGWVEGLRGRGLRGRGLPDHLAEHFAMMARHHAQNRYDHLTSEVERVAGHPATSVKDFISRRADRFRAAA
jgi:uncharacterized protein YbjT (DUF2867 family)